MALCCSAVHRQALAGCHSSFVGSQTPPTLATSLAARLDAAWVQNKMNIRNGKQQCASEWPRNCVVSVVLFIELTQLTTLYNKLAVSLISLHTVVA